MSEPLDEVTLDDSLGPSVTVADSRGLVVTITDSCEFEWWNP